MGGQWWARSHSAGMGNRERQGSTPGVRLPWEVGKVKAAWGAFTRRGRTHPPWEGGGGGGGMSQAGCRGANVWVKDVKGRRSSRQLSVWSEAASEPRRGGLLLGGVQTPVPPKLWRDGSDAEVPASQPRVNARKSSQAGCSPLAWLGHGRLLFHRRASTSRNLLGSRVDV